ncbi:MAG: glycine cleavage system aminomethyltransferase GcvT [Candidatus Izemoplasmataceae bacterium]
MYGRSGLMKQTILHDAHVKLNAKMVDFAGWHMPISYTGITEEHLAVRKEAGLFDVSHMGEIYIVGKEATDFVDYLFTNNVRTMTAKQILYGMMCYENGGVVDDLLVYKVNDEFYLLVVNASNIDKDLEWINKNNKFDALVVNKSEEISEIAIQGPKAQTMLQKATLFNLDEIKFFTFDDITVYDRNFLVSRTGYTGEDGFEIYGDHEDILYIFEKLIDDNDTLQPCGLGCRDTLRFEVALPLYGNELSPDITPVEAGLNFAISFEKGDFIGKDVLMKQKELKPNHRIVGLEMLDKGILRHGYKVYHEDTLVGEITTGYRSPSTDLTVAMALIDKPYDKKDTILEVEIRNKRVKVKVRNKKFYDKKYNK